MYLCKEIDQWMNEYLELYKLIWFLFNANHLIKLPKPKVHSANISKIFIMYCARH